MSKRNKTPRAKQSTLFRRTAIASLLSLATSAHGSIVTDAIDYQYFRDFAENKGKFTVGANRIEITDKTGASRGQMFPEGEAGMPDLAVTSTNGVAHLVDPQYVASVKHNGGYGNVHFGTQRGNNFAEKNFDYLLVARNDKPNSGANGEWTMQDDYHVPRLHKLVTEVAPIPILRLTGEELKLLADRERFPYIVRTGAGTQSVRPATGDDIPMGDAYLYGIGGNVMNNVTVQNNHIFFIGVQDNQEAVNNSQYGPMPTVTMGGDSGSPVFAYDAKEKQWVAISVHHGGDRQRRNWTVLHHPDFVDNIIAGDKVVVENKVKDGRLIWQPADKTSVITSPHDPNLRAEVNLRDASLADDKETRFRHDLNHGKTLHITGEEGMLRIGGNTHQGAGALYFDNNFTVIGASNETTWLGAGVSVAEGKTVNWQVHNPEGDRLSKVGSGSLNVSGVGVNKGKISVGEGKVLLNQRPDAQGQTQAFSEVHITSGRPTVVLGDDKQVNPDNIVFGFRGGRLDVNGNDLTFSRLRSVDSGAKIVNHNENKAATVTLNQTLAGVTPITADQVVIETDRTNTYKPSGIYKNGPYNDDGRVDYYELKEGANPSRFLPNQKGESNNSWQYLASDEATAKRLFAERENERRKAGQTVFFEGQLGESDATLPNGKLDFVYRPQHSVGRLVLNGGMNLNGNVTVADGTLMLSGSPVPHAYDFRNKKDVVLEDDWAMSNFTANAFQVTGGTLSTSRDVKTITGDIHASQNARVNLGFVNGETDVCYRSDFTGVSHCQNNAIADNLVKPLTVNGNATVQDQAHLTLVNTTVSGSLNAKNQANITLKNKAIAKEVNLQDTAKLNFANTGDILNTKVSGTRNSQVSMQAGSHWTLPENTTIGHLFGDIGSEITLNPAGTPQVFQQLTLNGDLSGNVKFNLASDLGEGKADKVVVHGYANGKHELAVRHTGAEAKVDELTLVELKHGGQEAKDVAFSLQGGHVDAGALRYTLENDPAKRYYLFNREKADEIKAKREEEARKAAEAEAKAKQELADAIAARERAEKARTEAEEALRQAIANGSVSAQALLDAQHQAEEARRLADQAQADKTRAENLLAEKERELAAANTAKTQAENQIQAAEAEKTRLQNQLNEANTAKQNAEQAAQTAAEKQQQAENEKTAAQTALAEAERLKAEAERALAAAQADGGKALADAQAALADAQKQVADKTNELAEAQTALNTANTLKDQAIVQANQAEAAKAEAEKNLTEVQKNLTQAQADKTAAENLAKEAEAAKLRAEQVQKELEQAQAAQAEALKNAQEAARVAEVARENAEREAARQAELAKQAEAEAQRQADLAKQAETAKQAAENAQKLAEEAKNQAQADLTASQNAKTAAENAQKLAENALQAALNAKNEAETAKNQAQTDLANALKDKQAAEEALKVAQANGSQDVANLQNQLAQVNQLVKDKEAALAQAQSAQQNAENQRDQAQAAKNTAEAALNEMRNQLAKAEADKQAADLAKQQAEADKQAAELAKQQAEAEAQRQADLAKQAETAKQAAENAQKLAEEAKNQAQADLTASQNAKTAAENAQKLAEDALQAALNAKNEAENAKNQAQSDLANALKDKQAAEEALKVAQANGSQDVVNLQNQLAQANQLVKDKEAALAQAQSAQQNAENQRDQAQAAKNTAEAALNDMRNQLAKAEADKQAADLAKQQAEADKQAAELAKQKAEAEAQRQADLAKQAETAKQAAELQAQNAQQAQVLAEQAKQAAEAAKQAAEQAQAEAEAANQRLQAAANADAQTIANARAELANAQKVANEKTQALEAANGQLQNMQAALNQAQQQAALVEQQRQQEQRLREQAQAAQLAAENAQKAAEQARADAVAAQNRSEAEKQAAQTKLAQAEQLAKDKAAEAQQLENQRAELAKQLADSLTQAQNQAAELAKAQADAALAEAKAKEEEAKRLAAEAERERLAQEAAAAKAAADAAAARQQKQADVISQYANAALSEVAVQAHHLKALDKGVEARLRDLNGRNSGVWMQTQAEKSEHASEQYRAFKQNSTLTQLGADTGMETAHGHVTVGASLNHLRYTADYDDQFSGEGQSTTGTVYGKWHTPNGFALMGDVSYGQAKSELSQDNRSTDIKRNVASAGVGVSQDWNVAGVDVQAHTGVKYHHVGHANYELTAADGQAVKVEQDKIGIVSYQAGVNVGKTIETANGLKIRPQVGVNYRHTNSDADVKVNGQVLKQDFASEWESQAGIGFAKDNWEIKVKAQHSRNTESGKRNSALIGASWKW